MTVQEAADFMHVNPSLVRRWIRDKRLKATKHGRDYWITEQSLAAFAELPRTTGRPRKR